MRRGIDPLHLYISISALSYFYFSNTPTLSTAFGRKLATAAENKLRRKHVVEVILAYLKAPSFSRSSREKVPLASARGG
jgi:TetR/AcrR family transcriptional regulator